MSGAAIDRFEGEYDFLSNFYRLPSDLTLEHFYQGAKARSEEEMTAILDAPSPAEAKRLGRAVRLSPYWEDMKVEVMLGLLRRKFTIPFLRDRLLATGNRELIEGNHWNDTFWGVCNGVGENRLGRLLMQVREEMRQ